MNLAIQIFIGFLEQNSVIVMAVIVAFIVLYGLLMVIRPKTDTRAIKQTLLGAAAAWGFFMLMIPSLTMSSLSQLTYLTDWLMLTVMSSGYAALVALLLYPMVRMVNHIKN